MRISPCSILMCVFLCVCGVRVKRFRENWVQVTAKVEKLNDHNTNSVFACVCICVCVGLLCGDPVPSRNGCPG